MNGKILGIKKYPNPVLREMCEVVEKITQREIELLEDMVFTMQGFDGLGLAAPQVGRVQRLCVVRFGEGVLKLVNPEIIQRKGGWRIRKEGCLSIPGVDLDIERWYKVMVKSLNEKGETIWIRARDVLARVLQHEIDHLNGRLIIDYKGEEDEQKA